MGNLFALLTDKTSSDAFLDFHKADPPTDPSELKVYHEMAEIIRECPIHLKKCIDFTNGNPAKVKASMAKPTDIGLLTEAFEAIVPNALIVKEFKDFSDRISVVVRKLAEVLMSPDDTGLKNRQGLASQLADLLDFILQFDQAKMKNSAIMNDFSQYRRSIGKLRDHPMAIIKEAETNSISMFIAIHIPMTTTLATEFSSLFSSRKEVVDCLASLANICCNMATNDKCGDEADSVNYVLRVMTGAIILYDHVDPAGVFGKSSPIKITNCIKALKKRGNKGLVNSIRYSSVSYGKETTPSAIKKLIEDP